MALQRGRFPRIYYIDRNPHCLIKMLKLAVPTAKVL